jgi:hypothetical protein
LVSELLVPGSRSWRIGRAIAGALGFLFSIAYLIEGRDLRMGTMDAPGPGVFPLIVGMLFALVSLGVIADALTTREPGTARFPAGPSLRRVLIVSSGFVAYVLSLPVLGFVIATVLFVALYTRVVGRISWLAGIFSGACITAAVWTVFALLLEVHLPEAIWS